jgi:NH3-dependent NAD+ synthetase
MTDEVQALAEVDSAPEQVVTAEPVAEEVSTPEEKPVEQATKTFSQEELDAAIGKRLAREQRKWEREQAAKLAEMQAKQAPREIPPADQFESPEDYA